MKVNVKCETRKRDGEPAHMYESVITIDEKNHDEIREILEHSSSLTVRLQSRIRSMLKGSDDEPALSISEVRKRVKSIDMGFFGTTRKRLTDAERLQRTGLSNERIRELVEASIREEEAKRKKIA